MENVIPRICKKCKGFNKYSIPRNENICWVCGKPCLIHVVDELTIKRREIAWEKAEKVIEERKHGKV